MLAETSFISTPLPARGGTTYHSASVCTKSRSKVRATLSRKLRMESSDLKTTPVPETAEQIIRNMWDKCENAEYSSWLPYFDESAVFHDTLYPKPFVGKSEIAKHLKNMESAIPSSIVLILDDLVAGPDRVGARWHAETTAGAQIPLSRGASMYSFIQKEGKLLISEAWDFPETPLKLAGIVLPLFRGASAVLSLFAKQAGSTRN